MGSIRSVTLYEDRAAVDREAHAEAGRSVVVFDGISPLVRTQMVSFPGLPEGLVVEDVAVHRSWVPQGERDVGDLFEAYDVATRRLAAATSAARAAKEQSKRRAQIVDRLLLLSPRVLGAGEEAEPWLRGLQSAAERATDAAVEMAEREHLVAVRSAERDRAQQARDLASSGPRTECARLEVTVSAKESASLIVRTIVPCAAWRPVHRATLGADDVFWELGAAIWNHTGEDWDGVPVTVSTARPGDRGEVPSLEDDVAFTSGKSSEVVAELREEEVHRVKRAKELPGVADGGKARSFSSSEPISAPSSGWPVFIELDSFRVPARVEWVCAPELASQVVRQATLSNGDARPLLAGPVELIRGDTRVGTSRIDLIPSGEEFQLGFGSHDGLRVVRTSQRKQKSAMITGTQTHTQTVSLKVTNFDDEPVTVRIVERVVVSELKEVSVASVDAKPALVAEPDKDGMVAWVKEIKPGLSPFELVVKVEASSSVVMPW